MKYKLKIITLLTLGTLSAVTMAQVPNQVVQNPSVTTTAVTTAVTTTGTTIVVPAQEKTNDYSQVGEGNNYERSVTPLLREISRKKSILELKKLDKEITKLDEIEIRQPAPGFVPMPAIQNPSVLKPEVSAPVFVPEEVRILMIYGAEDDLYAKIAVGNQGGYPVRKGDVLPDGRYVLKVNNNYIEVQKTVTKSKSKSQSKTEKIFVSASNSSNVIMPNSPRMQGNNSNINFLPAPVPTNSLPSLTPLPTANYVTGNNLPR